MNLDSLTDTLESLSLGDAKNIPSGLLSFVFSLNPADVLIVLNIAVAFIIPQVLALRNARIFKIRRKRTHYLSKIDDQGNYQGSFA